MDDIINELIRIIKTKGIKYVTICESNHRSYTCHTFQYKLIRALYENKIIDTFSSERLGINDAEIINHYLRNGLDIDKMVEKLPFGGMGFYRVVKYFSKKPLDSFSIVGLEEDKYCPKSPQDLITHYKTNKDREEFWLDNIKKTISERGNLFINGYHLAKGDMIGKYFLKHHRDETLFLSMCALEITTQILTIDKVLYPKEDQFEEAIIKRDYQMRVERIDKVCPPTDFETKYDDWKLIKINKRNQSQKFRAIGCYLALYEEEYKDKVDISEDVTYPLKNYDYMIFFKKSVYREKMFY